LLPAVCIDCVSKIYREHFLTAKREEAELICEWRLTSFSSRTAKDATTGDRIHQLLCQRTGELVFFLSRACSLICGQSFRPLPMTLLITFSWRFLLRLALERARRLSWGVARNPAKVGLGVRECPHIYADGR
jgi:hypothetical protein